MTSHSNTMRQHAAHNIKFDIKSISEAGSFFGYASVYNIIDSHHDIIEAGAFDTSDIRSIKLLWQHRAEEPIGVITRLTEDSKGLFVEGKILTSIARGQEAYDLVKAGAIDGLSIGFSIQDAKVDAHTGIRHITSATLWEISLVTFPANPKALVSAVKQHHYPSNQTITFKEKTMLTQQQNDKIDMLGHAWEEFKRINDQRLHEIESKGVADPLTTAHVERINKAMDDYQLRLRQLEQQSQRPFMGTGEGSHEHEHHPHKQAFMQYLRKGNDALLLQMDKKALSVQSDPDGGYLVTPTMSNEVTQKIIEVSPLRSICSVETISSDSLEVLEDLGDAAVGWTNETDLITNDTATPSWSKKNIPVYELYAQPKATQKLLDDAAFNVESWLVEKLTLAFSQYENQAFVHGDGIGKPRGFCTYPNGLEWGQIEQVASGTPGHITGDALVMMYYGLKQDYARNATFAMNRWTVQAIRQIKVELSGSQQYLWQPGLAAGTPDTLLGLPVVEVKEMETPAPGKLVVALADFRRAYRIVDRMGVRVFRDPYTNKPFVKFYSTKRVGGDVTNFEAIKLLKIDN